MRGGEGTLAGRGGSGSFSSHAGPGGRAGGRGGDDRYPARPHSLGDGPQTRRADAPVRPARGGSPTRPGKEQAAPVRRLRCAIYTRTSSEERLSQEFNSLDAQREACEAYIASQRHEGWTLCPDFYDDGGWSGGSLERPALTRLLADIAGGRVDIVVAYKIDRVSRSMRDFMNLIDLFDRHGVACVSVTQAFNTTSSMGRLTLNMLLSFAQFEREQGRERVRDKIAASRARGIWMGGTVPLGYVVRDRRLIIDEAEAATVRMIFARFAASGAATALARALAAEGVRTKTGRPIDKGALYQILNNRTYLGLAVHKGTAYPGEHQAIVSQDLWDRVHAVLKVAARTRARRSVARTPALLRGLLYGPDGPAMSPTHTRRKGRLYRYYVSQTALKRGAEACPVRRVGAEAVETAVIAEMRRMVQSPEIVIGTWRQAREGDPAITEDGVRAALERFEGLWEELFPAEQARLVQLLIARVDLDATGLSITLRIEGLTGLATEMGAGSAEDGAAHTSGTDGGRSRAAAGRDGDIDDRSGAEGRAGARDSGINEKGGASAASLHRRRHAGGVSVSPSTGHPR